MWPVRVVLLGLVIFLNSADNVSASRFVNREENSNQCGFKKKGNVVDLEVSGRIKCLVCGPLSSESSATPLIDSTSQKQPSLFGFVNYRFEKQRWYGLTGLGTIVRWQMQNHRPKFPRIVDLVAEKGLEYGYHSWLDSTCIRLDWGESDSPSSPSKPSLEVCCDYNEKIARLGWFLPIFKRLHLHCNSYFPWNKSKANAGPTKLHQMSSKKYDENEDWWIPTLKLDPFGAATSENNYKAIYNDRYLVHFRLRIIKSISFLSTWDDEHDTRVRVECSMIDAIKDNSISTARLEAQVEASDWLRSIDSTRLILMHEHSISRA